MYDILFLFLLNSGVLSKNNLVFIFCIVYVRGSDIVPAELCVGPGANFVFTSVFSVLKIRIWGV